MIDEETGKLAADNIRRKALPYPPPAGLTESQRPVAVVEHAAQRRRQAVGIVDRNDQTTRSLAVLENVGHTVGGGSDKGHAARHRLDRRYRKPFVSRGERISVCSGKMKPNHAPVVDELVAPVDPARVGLRDAVSQPVGVISRPDDEQPQIHVGSIAADPFPGVKEHVQPFLVPGHTAVPDDHSRLVGQVQRRSSLRAWRYLERVPIDGIEDSSDLRIRHAVVVCTR